MSRGSIGFLRPTRRRRSVRKYRRARVIRRRRASAEHVHGRLSVRWRRVKARSGKSEACGFFTVRSASVSPFFNRPVRRGVRRTGCAFRAPRSTAVVRRRSRVVIGVFVAFSWLFFFFFVPRSERVCRRNARFDGRRVQAENAPRKNASLRTAHDGAARRTETSALDPSPQTPKRRYDEIYSPSGGETVGGPLCEQPAPSTEIRIVVVVIVTTVSRYRRSNTRCRGVTRRKIARTSLVSESVCFFFSTVLFPSTGGC